MKKSLFVGLLLFVLGAVTSGTIGHFATKGLRPPYHQGRRGAQGRRRVHAADHTLQLPTEFTVGDRTYELVPILKTGETSVSTETVLERASELKAELGQEDGEYILRHQRDDLGGLGDRSCMVFPRWRGPGGRLSVAFLDRRDGEWRLDFVWLGRGWYGRCRLARRKS